jgi:hypothetical protein
MMKLGERGGKGCLQLQRAWRKNRPGVRCGCGSDGPPPNELLVVGASFADCSSNSCVRARRAEKTQVFMRRSGTRGSVREISRRHRRARVAFLSSGRFQHIPRFVPRTRLRRWARTETYLTHQPEPRTKRGHRAR